MNKQQIINNAKVLAEDKSALSIKLSSKLKSQIVSISEDNSIFLNTLVVAVLDDFVNGEDKKIDNLDIVSKLEGFLAREIELEDLYEKVGGHIEFTNGTTMNVEYELSNIKFMIRKLKEIL